MTIEPKEEYVMREKKDKAFYISRAKQDIRNLFIYFDVTRPRHEKNYFNDGKFSLDKLMHQLDFLKVWSRKIQKEMKSVSKYHTIYSRTFNYVFGIPHDLMEKVAGVYYDEDGKQHRVNYQKIVDELEEEGFVKVLNHGNKKRKNENGEYKPNCWWCKKYIMANRNQWLKLMSEDKYDDINKYGSDRLRKIVFNWISKFKKENQNVEPTKVEPTKVEPTKVEPTKVISETENTEQKKIISETEKDNQAMDDNQKKTISDKAIRALLIRGVISPETSVKWIGDFVYRGRKNQFTIDEATMLYNTKPEDKNQFVDTVLTYLRQNGFLESSGLHSLVRGLKEKSDKETSNVINQLLN